MSVSEPVTLEMTVPAVAADARALAVDRGGWALATGSGSWALAAGVIAWGSGGGAGTIMLGIAAGAAIAATLVVLIGVPAWWLAVRAGRANPITAGLIGAGVGVVAAMLGLARDGAIWSGVAAMTIIAAFLGALTALAMWLVAYPAR